MSDTKTSSVYARLNAVKAEVKRIPKNGFNEHFRFKFSTESDIIDVIRPLCAEHGVALVYHGPDPDRIKIEDGGATKSGTRQMLYQLWVRYEVVNVDDPSDRFEVWGYGEGLDTSDKGHSKALTNAHKYVIIRLFDVSTGDPLEDPDAHGTPGDQRAPIGNQKGMDAALAKGRENRDADRPSLKEAIDALGWTVDQLRDAMMESGDVSDRAKIEAHPSKWAKWAMDVAWNVVDAAKSAPPQEEVQGIPTEQIPF